MDVVQNMLDSVVTPKLNSMELTCANVVKGLEENSTVMTETAQKVTQLEKQESKNNNKKIDFCWCSGKHDKSRHAGLSSVIV